MSRHRLVAAALGLTLLCAAGCGNSTKVTHPANAGRPSLPTTTSSAGTDPTSPSSGSASSSSPAAQPPYAPSDSLPPKGLSEVPRTTGPGESTAEVSVSAPDSEDDIALAKAADHPGCVAQTVPGTIHIATVKATGVSWAIAGFTRVSGCTEDPLFFVTPPPGVGVLERQPGGNWVLNSEDGKPFPCPPGPGPDNGGPGDDYIPPVVLQAWQMPYYSSNCVTYVAPGPGQGH